MSDTDKDTNLDRRTFLEQTSKGIGMFVLGGITGKLLSSAAGEETVWQIDPLKCIHCEKCATACVLTPSASKCVDEFAICGYCRVCTGFFPTNPPSLDEGAENQLCPVGAIKRAFIEEPYYEYTIDKALCIGCARCVKGCTLYGNGSLYLQIDRTICVNCNQCAIALVCEPKAIRRIPAHQQYLPKGKLQV